MNTIPIFYASDDNYAKPLCVSMASVLANTEAFVNFYILENNISSSNKEKIRLLKEKFNNFSVKFISVNMEIFKNFPDLNWYTLNMYSRFLIPEKEPSLNKAIYLDVDIILKSDILNLYNIDIQDYPLGAVVGERKYLDSQNFIEHINNLNISKEHIYFGSGVLLLNCKIWREQCLFKKLIDIISINKDKLKYPDQDALNILFDCNYKQIDLNWNRDIGCINDEYKYNKNVIDKCFLIHYDGDKKPWNTNIITSEIFWEYAKYTQFYDELRQKYEQNLISNTTCNNSYIKIKELNDSKNIKYRKNKLKNFNLLKFLQFWK